MLQGFVEKLKDAAQSKEIVNPYHGHECTVVIAFGSEKGTTMVFAIALHQYLLEQGIKSRLIEMNQFEKFPVMEHFIILTSTYGVGNAPINALQFRRKFNLASIKAKFKYAVVGFGSKQFPKFCHYAENVNFMLHSYGCAEEWIPLTKINDQSLEEFETWLTLLIKKMKGQLSLIFNDASSSKDTVSIL